MDQGKLVGYHTKQDLAYLALKEFIVSGVFAPGERLIIRDLAQRLKVSETPVRAAITRLSSEGLLTHVSHLGAVVGSVSDDDILDIHVLVGTIQGLAAARAALKAVPDDLSRLRALVERVEALPDGAPHTEWAVCNMDFHYALAEVTGSPVILSLTKQLLERVSVANAYWALPANREKAVQEHREVMSAIEAGAAELARQTMEQHWLRGGRDFLNQVEAQRRSARRTGDT